MNIKNASGIVPFVFTAEVITQITKRMISMLHIHLLLKNTFKAIPLFLSLTVLLMYKPHLLI